MKTIVSITPLKVQEDSRTFKIAASFARFGYRSIVVEGAASNLNRSELPFELISIRKANRLTNVASAPSQNISRRGLLKRIYDRLPNTLKRLYLTLYYLGFVVQQGLRPLRHIPRASLYYLHAPYGYPSVSIKRKRYKVPFIYDAHDFYPVIETGKESSYDKHRINGLLAFVERRCCKHAAAVVTVGDGVAQLHRELFNTNPIIIRNCQDYRLDKKPAITLRQFLNLSPNNFLLVSVGQTKPGMAVEELLTAMQKLPANVHVAFVGKNAGQYNNLIQQLGLTGRVHFLPPVMPFEVVPFIESADAAIILYYPRTPNYYYSLPNRFFQAVAAGLPLLYPELPEIEKIANKYKLGILIDTRNPDSIKDGISQMISSTEKMSKYRKNAQKARDELSWEREENILHELIIKVLGKAAE